VRGLEVSADDELCLCAVTRLELLYSARSAEHYERLEQDLTQFRDLRMDAETFAAAVSSARARGLPSTPRPHPRPADRLLRPAALR
jgi:predicted nucleic acid-binding protein